MTREMLTWSLSTANQHRLMIFHCFASHVAKCMIIIVNVKHKKCAYRNPTQTLRLAAASDRQSP
jgi:hypothetical protein